MRAGLVTLLIGVLLLVLSLGGATLWKARQPSSDGLLSHHLSPSTTPDPRLTFATSYKNVAPGVEYVGDEACAACHVAQATTFRQHPMGRSAAYVSGSQGQGIHTQPLSDDAGERFDKTSKNPFEALGLEFLVQPRGQATVHKEIRRDAQHRIVAELEADVFLAIGSGTQGRSYVVNRDGYLFQSPISWFSDTHSWGLSPGFGEGQIHFSRAITDQCLFCHIDWITPVPHTAYRYVLPLPGQVTIGCERCHGPGQLHVKQREAGEPFEGADDTIVNPAHLEPSLRDAVCQQCHLMGEERVVRRGRNLFDYRPGLPLHLFISTFVRSPEMDEGQKSVSHVEQMIQSRCFRQSTDQNKLGCISCHDPHQLPVPEKRVAFYRARCLACHEISADGGAATHKVRAAAKRIAQGSLDHSPKQGSAPLTIRHSATDDCSACHMTRRTTSNVAHEAITDHRILRNPNHAGKIHDQGRSGSKPGQFPLVYFDRDLHDPQDPEVLRDLAVAMINIARRESPSEIRQALCQRAVTLLNRAVQTDADDIDALEAKGYGLWVRANPQKALEAFEKVLAKVPEREVSRKAAAELAADLRQNDKAMSHFRQLLATNPWDPAAHYLLAKLLAQSQDWPGAIEEASAVLRLDPTDVAARSLLVAGYLRSGDRKRARQEFDIVERLQPAHLEQLRAWFKKETR